MKNKLYNTVYIILLILLLIWGWFNFYPEIILVKTNDKLFISSEPYIPAHIDSTPAVLDKTSGEIFVINCEDIKTDVIIQVKTQDGIGYIENGSFFLVRRRATLTEIFTKKDIVTSSCIGML